MRCAPSRASRAPRRRVKGRHAEVAAFRSRRLAPPSAEGRWTLVPRDAARQPQRERASARPSRSTTTTKWAAAVTQQLLARHGVVTREAVAADGVAGGFGIVYPGAERHGRDRPHPPRLLRRRPRRDAVRAARRARSAALAARCAGRTRDRGPGRDRSGEPVRRRAQMARATINAELADLAERPTLCGLSGFGVGCRGRWAQPDPIGRRDGDPGQRRARGVSAARRSAARSPSCPTPSRIDPGSDARSRAC